MNKQEFFKKYPAALQELLISPCVFKENFSFGRDLPFPGIGHIRDICEYAGFSNGALRTALSRIVKAKQLDFFYDEHKIKRFTLTKSQHYMSKTLSADIGNANGFSIVIFTFTTEQEKQRREARELLQRYGFRLFAQNTYIRRKIEKEHFEKSLKEIGLQNNVFILDCGDPGTKEFKERLFSQFEMDRKLIQINTFYENLTNFLSEDLDGAEYARRILYAGPVYYSICFEHEVPIPETYFPVNYRIKELKVFFQSIPDYRWKDFITYYKTIEAKGEAR